MEPVSFSAIEPLRFETEAEWPVLSARDAWAIPGFPPNDCVSKRRALIAHPSGRQPTIEIALPVPYSGRYSVGIGWVVYDVNPTTITLTLGPNVWKSETKGPRFHCGNSWGPLIDLAEGEQPLKIELENSTLGIDWVELLPAS